jgi:hypothetical protein
LIPSGFLGSPHHLQCNQNCAEYGYCALLLVTGASCGNAAAQNGAKGVVNRRTCNSPNGWPMSSEKPLGSGANNHLGYDQTNYVVEQAPRRLTLQPPSPETASAAKFSGFRQRFVIATRKRMIIGLIKHLFPCPKATQLPALVAPCSCLFFSAFRRRSYVGRATSPEDYRFLLAAQIAPARAGERLFTSRETSAGSRLSEAFRPGCSRRGPNTRRRLKEGARDQFRTAERHFSAFGRNRRILSSNRTTISDIAVPLRAFADAMMAASRRARATSVWKSVFQRLVWNGPR